MTRYYLEIHMQGVGLATNLSAPNCHCYDRDKNFTKCYNIEKAPKSLRDFLDLDEDRFFKEKTLEEVIANYNVTPVYYHPGVVLHGYVEIEASPQECK